MWKICSPSGVSRSRTKPSASGVRRSGLTTHGSCDADEANWGDTWCLDEVFVTIHGRRQYLWRAVDQDGDRLDILVQPRRDRRAAVRFFRKVLKGQGRSPCRLITDKLRSYSAAHRAVMPSVVHSTRQYENNRAEVSHQTDAPARATDAPIQVRRARAAVSLDTRTRAESLSGRPPPAPSRSPPFAENACVPRLG